MQREFDFGTMGPRTGSADGLTAWRETRQAALIETAKKLGFPLAHECEVWLKCGIRLRGILRLKEEELFFKTSQKKLKFVIGGTSFDAVEIESCVRLD